VLEREVKTWLCKGVNVFILSLLLQSVDGLPMVWTGGMARLCCWRGELPAADGRGVLRGAAGDVLLVQGWALELLFPGLPWDARLQSWMWQCRCSVQKGNGAESWCEARELWVVKVLCKLQPLRM